MSSTHLSEAGFLCELPCPKHAWEHHCCQDPVSDHMLYFRCQTSMREFFYIFALPKKTTKKQKERTEAHVLISNKPVTGQIPTLQQPTCFLAFCQHSFYPQNEATSGCLAAKWHHCLQQGRAQALGVPQDHHAGCADCPEVLCHPWAGTPRMCLYGHNTRPCSPAVLVCPCAPRHALHSNAPLSLQGKADCL